MSTVKVEVVSDNEGYFCYKLNGLYFPFSDVDHKYRNAEFAASGSALNYAEDDIRDLGLIEAEVVHTYEVEITE